MKTLTPYDLKQMRLIEKIELYENSKLDLHNSIYDLIGLLNALEFVDDSWKNDFQSEINFLERKAVFIPTLSAVSNVLIAIHR
jgi:hypothetical protein